MRHVSPLGGRRAQGAAAGAREHGRVALVALLKKTTHLEAKSSNRFIARAPSDRDSDRSECIAGRGVRSVRIRDACAQMSSFTASVCSMYSTS
eukprot:6196302-Pleurochrysis_carterae.AAC.1